LKLSSCVAPFKPGFTIFLIPVDILSDSWLFFRLLIDRSHVDLKNLNITLEKLSLEDSSNSSVRSRRHVDILSDAYLLETPRRRFRRQAATIQSPLLPSTTTFSPESTKSIELSPASQTLISKIPIRIDGASLLSFHVSTV